MLLLRREACSHISLSLRSVLQGRILKFSAWLPRVLTRTLLGGGIQCYLGLVQVLRRKKNRTLVVTTLFCDEGVVGRKH